MLITVSLVTKINKIDNLIVRPTDVIANQDIFLIHQVKYVKVS